jgi:uncharacterized protein (TIGR03435 family)
MRNLWGNILVHLHSPALEVEPAKSSLTAKNSPVRWILEAAWDLSQRQITGPDWIDKDRYDLEARAPEGVPDTEIKPMLQALLKERFKLEAHVEMREMPVYNLVVAKEGPKIKPFDPEHPGQRPARVPGASMLVGGFEVPQIAMALAGTAGRPVIDKTGLQGRYFLAIQYSQLGTNTETDGAPDIFGAVQQQLGLKLEPAKAQVQVLFVDHLDRTPTEN